MTDAEIVAVVTAHMEGKQIQHRLNDSTDGNPSDREWKDVKIGYVWPWNFLQRDYRVKPEPRKPREWSVFVTLTGGVNSSCPLNAESQYENIRVREVIDE